MQVSGLVPYRRHDTWGYCLPDRTLVVGPRFEQAFPFGDHELAHVRQGQRSGLMRRDGTLAVEPVYDWIGNEDEGYLVEPWGCMLCSRDGQFGVLDLDGRLREPVLHPHGHAALEAAFGGTLPELPPPPHAPHRQWREVSPEIAGRYDVCHPVEEGLALFLRDGLYGWVDEEGTEVLPADRYVSGSPFEEGLAKVAIVDPDHPGGRRTAGGFELPALLLWGYIDRHGNEVVPIRYRNARFFDRGLAFVMTARTMMWG
ncbi:MAG: WG repeat-containing protein, partial [Myxococcales bacterium]|nr:WG repeat-containing protein [Myxococcales bacterium]